MNSTNLDSPEYRDKEAEEANVSRAEAKYFTDRLEDVGLLDFAVAVGQHKFLAVPAGGKRRGGWVQVAGKEDGAKVILLLALLPGFEKLRFVAAGKGRFNGWVHWGKQEPKYPKYRPRGLHGRIVDALHDIACGRYFGYSEKAIHKLIRKNYKDVIVEVEKEPALAPATKKPTKRKPKA